MSYVANSIKFRSKDGKVLNQDEAVALVKKRAHKNGFSYRTTKLSDGSVKLVLTKSDKKI